MVDPRGRSAPWRVPPAPQPVLFGLGAIPIPSEPGRGEAQLQEAQSQELVVDHIVGSAEVVRHQDVLLRRAAVWLSRSVSLVGSLPPILDVLHQASDAVFS